MQEHSLVAQTSSQPVEVAELAGKTLFLLVQGHGLVQFAPSLQDHRLVAQAALQPVEVAELPTNTLLFFVEGHCPVLVAQRSKGQPLVAEAPLKRIGVARSAVVLNLGLPQLQRLFPVPCLVQQP